MSSAQRHPDAPDTGADRTGCRRSLLIGADALADRSPKAVNPFPWTATPPDTLAPF